MTLVDSEQRLRALDTTGSFIVQAPAGSGKTALLTQRVLALLAGVEQPEEVVAITFTRKAAAEMKERVVEALRVAAGSPAPQAPFALQNWELAQAVLERDRKKRWGLRDNPGRLRITTIDGLSLLLLLSLEPEQRLDFPEQPSEQVLEFYQRAARRTLSDRNSKAVTALLDQLEHDLPRCQELLVEMLARRLGWVEQIGEVFDARPRLEGAIARVVGQKLEALEERLEPELAAGLAEAAKFSAAHLEQDWPWLALPGVEQSAVSGWKHLAQLCLKDNGEWRRTVTVKNGFPVSQGDSRAKAEAKAAKKSFRALLNDVLPVREDLRVAFQEVLQLPAEGYDQIEWERLENLSLVLLQAHSHLKAVFQEAGVVDFPALAHRAQEKLGQGSASLTPAPRHLLVDEFQDTSLSQFKLLEHLVLSWLPGDGRTLFLVGDPMQSIYRFREADVGLFERAKRQGIAHLRPDFLALRMNFRSHSGLVAWFRQIFEERFPSQDSPLHGAVAFAQAVSGAQLEVDSKVEVHPATDLEQEANLVCETAEELLRQNLPGRTIALLARSRTHLRETLRCFRAREIPFDGVALESLADEPHILDLYALTRALLNYDDRVAWLSLLRAPWCGLNSLTLWRLAQRERFLWKALNSLPEGLEDEVRERIAHLVAALAPALRERGRVSLRSLVEEAWRRLRGPALLKSEAELRDAERFFRVLEELDRGGDLRDWGLLDERLERLTSASDPAPGQAISVMTYHKSKGLEFDVVLLPGLGRRSGSDREQLLAWQEIPRVGSEIGVSDLLMAPLRAPGEDKSELSVFLEHLQRDRASHEELRLLYVACTRAISQIHLFGQAELDPELNVVKEPIKGTYLDRLWKDLAPHFQVLREQPNQVPLEEKKQVLYRIPREQLTPVRC